MAPRTLTLSNLKPHDTTRQEREKKEREAGAERRLRREIKRRRDTHRYKTCLSWYDHCWGTDLRFHSDTRETSLCTSCLAIVINLVQEFHSQTPAVAKRPQSDAAFVSDVGGKRHPLHSDARRMWLEPDCPCSTVPEVIARTLCTLICTTHSPLTRISSVGMLVNAHSDRKPPDDRR